ncbi:MAG: hypothetical protein EOT04_01570 [Candidatus Chaera renei]|uniref:Cell division protein FtsL n=1 Tax=Candidatus Chaera renei TaxID=2506947 RepID=A0A4Q0AIW3_9BACT|nr:MAG: hypothetical protein EOT04_01570 [Candidatus Chaera renei]
MTYYDSSLTINSRRGVLTTPGAWRRNQNTVAFGGAKTLGPVAHTVLLVLMLAVLGLIYLTQITKTSSYGYQINNLENKRSELISQRQDLQVENARLQALERVQQSSVAQTLTQPASVSYAN